MQEASSNNYGPVQNFDIQEARSSSVEEERKTIRGGTVETWERLSFAKLDEKSKIRPYITGLVMSIWAIWAIAGLVRCFTAGDPSLLLISSPFWLVPVRKILKFYFM